EWGAGRVRMGGGGVGGRVKEADVQVAELMRHEHASLMMAQRCSGVAAPTPLFSALLNYRHSSGAGKRRTAEARQAWAGTRVLYGEERTNYPLTLSIDDIGEQFVLTAHSLE